MSAPPGHTATADGPLGPPLPGGSARRAAKGGVLGRLYRRFGVGVLSIIIGLGLWEFFSRVVVDNRLFLAAPSQVVIGLVKLAGSGDLGRHIYVSTIEFVIGYVVACVAGIALGLAMASSPRAKKALQPWVSGLYATPVVALAPLFILWFGIGVWSKIAVVISLVIFTVSINTEVGLLQTSERLIDTFRSFGATKSQIFWKLSLPSAMPFILAGLKLGIGRGLIGVVVGELFGARAGLGQLIEQSAESFNMPDLFGGVVILAVAGIVLTAGFSWLERVLVPWNRE